MSRPDMGLPTGGRSRQGKSLIGQALGLKREGIFGLLMVLTALLGWVAALGAGGTMMMQQAYQQWSLSRQQTLTVYLPADSDPQTVATLMASLATEPAVTRVSRVSDTTLQALLAPYGGVTADLPVPVVLDVLTKSTATGDSAQDALTQRVTAAFPAAEVDDARALLRSVAQGVRLTQGVGVGVALAMAMAMAGLVVLTVRTGLRSQQATLALLRQLGGSDGQLIALVSRQVAERALLGWLLAVAGGGGALALMLWWWPLLLPMSGPRVWLALVLAPLVLPLVAVGCAALVTRAQVREMI